MAKKKTQGRGNKPHPSPNSKAGIKATIKKQGFKLPTVRDKKGRARAMSAKELRDYKNATKNFMDAGYKPDDKKRVKDFEQIMSGYFKKVKEDKPLALKKVHGIIPKITKKKNYHYTQAGSAIGFVMGEIEGLNRTVIVRRQGRDTIIDTPQKILNLTKALKKARSDYRKALREKSKKTGLKISDVMFVAATREGKNTVIDVDAIEYGGLNNIEIEENGLK